MLTPKLQRLVEIAETYKGLSEANPASLPQIQEFQKTLGNQASGQAWCMDFVLYCVKIVEREFSQPAYLYKSQSVLEVWNKSPKIIRLQAPMPGSIMVWQMWKNSTQTIFGHAGIVTGVSPGFIDTIEGNTSAPSNVDQIDREGDGVWAKKRTPGGSSAMKVLGWLLPWV